jgi:hypothetical protein
MRRLTLREWVGHQQGVVVAERFNVGKTDEIAGIGRVPW